MPERKGPGGRRGSEKKGNEQGAKGGKDEDSGDKSQRKEKSQEDRAKFFICLACENGVEEGEDCIRCHDCKQWAHKDCTSLSERDFQYLCDSTKIGIEWICNGCRKGEQEKRGEVDAKLDRLIKLFESVDTRLGRLESGCTGVALDRKIEEAVDKKVTEVWEEKVEKEKRELYLIFTNVPESSEAEKDDKMKDEVKKVQNLIEKVCPEQKKAQVKEPVRLGKANAGNRPRLLKVKVESVEAKREILRNAYSLNKGVTDQAKRIYINPDLTPTERQKNKELREELKRRIGEGEINIGIRGGKIVSVKWSPRPGQGDKDE
eukprot:TRINITY_DN10638_c0_g1_i2.p1 TRINITY_DN10638_c0_g1~~TRINITY_DN10638_c0_g1_i2.p1  ORF type:complete len:318 (+),score=67.76 TRINITY_DN10638_c0_g1_i2:392-1345(+)